MVNQIIEAQQCALITDTGRVMGEIEDKWMKRIKFGAWAIGLICTIGLAVWGFVTSPFALADELKKTDAKVEKVEKEVNKKTADIDEEIILMKIMIFNRELKEAVEKKDEAKIKIVEGELAVQRAKLIKAFGGN